MRKKRVLIGRLFHESHSFNPRPTTVESFQIERGSALTSSLKTSTSILAGMMQKIEMLGYHPVPSISAVAPPSGLVNHAFYLSLKAELIEAARDTQFDAIALELHGAMATPEIADVEGDLLTDLRAAVGDQMLIGVGLDLHGHLTPAMLKAADICIACKENPHADLFRCGERVVECLDAVMNDQLRPVSCLVKVPMILTGAAETGNGPLAELHRLARSAVSANATLWDVSIFNVYPFSDDVGMGQAIHVLSNDDPTSAIALSESLGDRIWQWRDRFVDDFWNIEDTLEWVAMNPDQRPVVIADMGDRVLGGAPGDSPATLVAALSRNDGLRGAIPITDPQSAAIAISSGVGSQLSLKVGGGFTPGFDPVEVCGEVLSTSDGKFRVKGPYHAGETTSLGPTAVLKVGTLSLMLTSLPGLTQDPNAFESQGVEIASQDFIVVKSGFHFKLSFQGVATPRVAETPGISRFKPGFFNWKRGRVYPAHSVNFGKASATVFDQRKVLS